MEIQDKEFFSLNIDGIAANIAFQDARIKTQFILNFSELFYKLRELNSLFEENRIVVEDFYLSEFNNWKMELKDVYKNVLEAERITTNNDQVSLSQSLNSATVDLYSKLILGNQPTRLKYTDLYNQVLSKVNSQKIGKLKEAFDTGIASRVESLGEAVNLTQKKAEGILTELEKRASKRVVADYAKEYYDLSVNKLWESVLWVFIGALSIASLVVVLVKIYNESILVSSIEEFPENIEFILLKVFILAVIVYVITFSLKQYNVCRNVSTIYREKAKALDSYKLLLASIDTEDKGTRDQLTIELAKSIYQNLNSGYVSDISGQKMNSGIYELTKNIVNQSTN